MWHCMGEIQEEWLLLISTNELDRMFGVSLRQCVLVFRTHLSVDDLVAFNQRQIGKPHLLRMRRPHVVRIREPKVGIKTVLQWQERCAMTQMPFSNRSCSVSLGTKKF